MPDALKKNRNLRDRDETFPGTFSDRWVRKTTPRSKEVQYAERVAKGHSLMLYVSPTGTKTWRALYYDNGKPRSEKLGTYPGLSVAEARHRAQTFNTKIAVASTNAGSFKKIAEDWFIDQVEAQGLVSKNEIRRQLETYIYPTLGDKPIFKIERSNVNELLRDIQHKKIRYDATNKRKKNSNRFRVGGRSQADAVLATIRSIMGWYATENDNYKSPIIPAMKRDKRKAHEKARHRTLDHDMIVEEGQKIRLEWNDRGEIRALWKACKNLGSFGALVQLLLLTGQRRSKVVTMKWSDLSDGVWTISASRNAKGTPGKIKLPLMATDILDKLPRLADNDYVFPAAGGKCFNSFSQHKRELDQKLPKDVRPWVLHDLRRTARSLMARADIADHIAERVLGHSIQGVQGIYNRFDYSPQKNAALQKLADEIAMILNPPDRSNVVSLPKRASEV